MRIARGLHNSRRADTSVDTAGHIRFDFRNDDEGPYGVQAMIRESRRSTRVRLKVVIEARAFTEPLSCDGETLVVNLHGALISTSVPLRVKMKIEIHVIPTDKRAPAKVVYVDPDRPRLCGIALEEPQNIWGLELEPEDWQKGDSA